MEYNFTTISFSNRVDEVEIHYPFKKVKKWYRKYLLKNLPILQKEFNYLDEIGYNIILPFTEEQLVDYEKDYMKEYINKVLIKYEVTHLYFPNIFKQYMPVNYGNQERSILKYGVLDQIVNKVLEKKKIEYKNLRLVIIDPEDYKMEYLLELFLKDLNYLTIITNRGEYFSEIREIIYDKVGLVLDIIKNPTKEQIGGNIIIDANENLNKNYSFFEKNAVVIDLESSREKLQYLYSRRKDLETIYDMVLSAKGSIVNNEMLEMMLSAKNFIFQNFKKQNSRNYGTGDLLQVMKQYDIELVSYKSTLINDEN